MFGKPKRYDYAATIELDDVEHEIEATYEVAWGSPPSGMSGPPEDYDPGSGSVAEAIRVEKVSGVPAAQADRSLVLRLTLSLDTEEHQDAMISGASHEDTADRDSYLEAEADERRMEARYGD
jgi:hypothetical protein